jgi:hypothetical protein
MNLSLYLRIEYVDDFGQRDNANNRHVHARKPRMMNCSGYWNYQNKIEADEISQDSEVDHPHPQQSSPLSKPSLSLSTNLNDHYPNHSNTHLLPNLSQLHWISILLPVSEHCILFHPMKLGN